MNPASVSTTVFRIYGVVQGVGFRPFVSRIAVRAGLTGSVANKGPMWKSTRRAIPKQ